MTDPELRPEVIEAVQQLKPPSLEDVYTDVLNRHARPESEALAEAIAGMFKAIPEALFGDDAGALAPVLDSLVPVIMLELRTADPEELRDGLAATLGVMLRRCAQAGVAWEEIARYAAAEPSHGG